MTVAAITASNDASAHGRTQYLNSLNQSVSRGTRSSIENSLHRDAVQVDVRSSLLNREVRAQTPDVSRATSMHTQETVLGGGQSGSPAAAGIDIQA
ncbi:MAG: hypothetical protein HQL63_05425 [Magnetococcales bacterium]|nr:hypothetical protein [Magnetococcales bacterium]MBF0322902.1 hypothetical protein [Magnetococcales bacterium]